MTFPLIPLIIFNGNSKINGAENWAGRVPKRAVSGGWGWGVWPPKAWIKAVKAWNDMKKRNEPFKE